MSEDPDKKFISNKIRDRQSGYLNHMKHQIGILDFDQGFANEFALYKKAHKFAMDVEEAIVQGNVDLEDSEIKMSKEAIHKIDSIMRGGCYYRIVYKDALKLVVVSKEIWYEEPPETGYCDIIALPKLRDMVPSQKLSDETWGIQIRGQLPVKFAIGNANYNTFIKECKLFDVIDGKVIPRIKLEDMNNLAKKTHYLQRDVYQSLAGDLDYFFWKAYAVLTNNWQKMIDYLQKKSTLSIDPKILARIKMSNE